MEVREAASSAYGCVQQHCAACHFSAEQHGMAQVTAHYVAMTPNGRVFDSSLDRGFPYDIRIGSGQVTAMQRTNPFLH